MTSISTQIANSLAPMGTPNAERRGEAVGQGKEYEESVEPSVRRAEQVDVGGFDSTVHHAGLRHATSWRDEISYSNPKLWYFIGFMVVLSVTVHHL